MPCASPLRSVLKHSRCAPHKTLTPLRKRHSQSHLRTCYVQASVYTFIGKRNALYATWSELCDQTVWGQSELVAEAYVTQVWHMFKIIVTKTRLILTLRKAIFDYIICYYGCLSIRYGCEISALWMLFSTERTAASLLAPKIPQGTRLLLYLCLQSNTENTLYFHYHLTFSALTLKAFHFNV